MHQLLGLTGWIPFNLSLDPNLMTINSVASGTTEPPTDGTDNSDSEDSGPPTKTPEEVAALTLAQETLSYSSNEGRTYSSMPYANYNDSSLNDKMGWLSLEKEVD